MTRRILARIRATLDSMATAHYLDALEHIGADRDYTPTL